MENSVSILDSKIAELISIGASIGGNCLPCLRYHFAEALKIGCTISEIEESIKLGKMVKERPINDIYKLAEDLINREKERN
ncbi:MAG: alkylhydroperoxidase AhpD family core domain protein [Ignavibacteriales bacterium CG_4_9_14_3_um_filter_30_11]|nr:MAG: alkylhydroperoxidase AhpD family core domain protein [Ignavibacteriales bacterium CG_4_9_14_3_um_filter_30_11]